MKINLINTSEELYIKIDEYTNSYDQIFIITQENIIKTKIANPLSSKYNIYLCKDAEECKSLEEYQKIVKYLANHKCNKNSLLVGLGGGTITDLCGFVASTYMRGISFINIPTTLLGMVDASIGGKTALNIGGKRNLIGTFREPSGLILYTQFLNSLSKKQLRDGYAEILKYALIMDKKLFQTIENNINSLIGNVDFDLINRIIEICINHKIKIVSQDQYDQGIRNILNFGHTIGHALESYYKFTLSHGQAILYGMKVASYLSLIKQNISQEQYDKIVNILNKFGTTPLLDLDIDKVLEFLDTDKKNIGGQLNYILLNDIGSAYTEKNYSKDNLIKGMEIL